jgi:hypothetical protein
MAKDGRPKIEIDKTAFVKLCQLQCTLQEIAGYFECSHDTIERWCKQEYQKVFSQVFVDLRSGGLLSLRRNQFKLAEKNATMAIWLGKQYLAQKDLLTINTFSENDDDPLTASIKASLKMKENED